MVTVTLKRMEVAVLALLALLWARGFWQVANQFDIEKPLGGGSQQAMTNRVIDSREAEINEIFGA